MHAYRKERRKNDKIRKKVGIEEVRSSGNDLQTDKGRELKRGTERRGRGH